jgi:hypothetical protein
MQRCPSNGKARTGTSMEGSFGVFFQGSLGFAGHKFFVVECSAIDLPLYARSKPLGWFDDDCMTRWESNEANKCLATRRRTVLAATDRV